MQNCSICKIRLDAKTLLEHRLTDHYCNICDRFTMTSSTYAPLDKNFVIVQRICSNCDNKVVIEFTTRGQKTVYANQNLILA